MVNSSCVPALQRMEFVTMRCITIILAATVISWTLAISAGMATPPPNYPVDAFDEVTMCMADPTCVVPIEERVPGDVGLAEDLTYRNPACVSGCIIVCDIHACWCEADEKCE